jgi:hypothetical protein
MSMPRAWRARNYLLLLTLLLVACSPGSLVDRDAKGDANATTTSPAGTSVATAVATPAANLNPLPLNPDKGVVGSSFTARLDGLKAGQNVSFEWGTWDGAYQTNPTPETVQYEQRAFTPRRTPLGSVTANDAGVAELTVQTPEDYGEVHDVFAVVDGKDVARGGFRVQLAATISPSEGPIGTPITLKVTGMGAMSYSGSTLAVRYDNGYTGILTATTTQGTAVAELRAAGSIGQHFIILNAGTIPAYLNIEQSPYDYVYSHLPDKESIRLPFKVTADNGLPKDSVDWPDPGRVVALDADGTRTTASPEFNTDVRAALSSTEGPIKSHTTLSATGLTPNEPVTAYWVTARGNRVTPSGWSLEDVPLFTTPATVDGTLESAVEIPDDLGGWHMIKLVQSKKLVAQVPYYVDRSLESVSTRRVHAGDTVVITLKGVGWTELDNGLAMTYDNAYAGYVCGFNSNGDVTLQVVATGAPGTHLIDLYPMVYAGKDKKAWYWTPVLTYGQDFPALSLGYRLQAFRIAIEIVD